jgi:dTDP-4-amino-4,6-dideoxygalactose transaminase
MGLVNLNFIEEICEKRKSQWLFYKDKLTDYSIKDMNYDLSEIDFNYAYFPILFETETKLLEVVKHLEINKISVRRYFYPSLNKLNYIPVKDECPISEDISKRVLCLPLYHDLTEEEQNLILTKIKEVC